MLWQEAGKAANIKTVLQKSLQFTWRMKHSQSYGEARQRSAGYGAQMPEPCYYKLIFCYCESTFQQFVSFE